ncbi:MAG: response regulator transcription factor [Clostridiales bacterium]|nr:response regulator transcription factor [Clostridiales bacterium]
MFNIALCDDEAEFLEFEKTIISSYLNEKGISHSITSFDSGRDLFKDKNRISTFNLIILDVEMADVDGITVAKKIREYNSSVNIAFLSAYMNYSTDGYRVRAVRFILKNKDDMSNYIHECIDCVLANLDLNDRKISLEFTVGKRQIKVSDVLYLQSKGNYTLFVFSSENKEHYLIRSPLKKVTEMMAPFEFISISAKETVNLYHVTSLSRYTLFLDNKKMLKISQNKYNDACKAFTLYKGKHL